LPPVVDSKISTNDGGSVMSGRLCFRGLYFCDKTRLETFLKNKHIEISRLFLVRRSFCPEINKNIIYAFFFVSKQPPLLFICAQNNCAVRRP
jgi:hypothetical protein